MLIERSLVRIDAVTLEKYLELYANDDSICLNDHQFEAINTLFELGHKHNFFDVVLNAKDFCIPHDYTSLRNT
jgi:1,4-dihydroxy-6-naphthoate synthase